MTSIYSDTISQSNTDSYSYRLSEAEAQFAACRYEAALQTAEGLQNLVYREHDKFRLCSLLANCHARLEQPAASLRYALQNLQHSQTLGDAHRAEAHYQVGRGYGMMAAEANALEHLLAAHRLYGCDNGKVLNGIAICHYLLEEYDQAREFFTEKVARPPAANIVWTTNSPRRPT